MCLSIKGRVCNINPQDIIIIQLQIKYARSFSEGKNYPVGDKSFVKERSFINIETVLSFMPKINPFVPDTIFDQINCYNVLLIQIINDIMDDSLNQKATIRSLPKNAEWRVQY